MLCRGHLSYLYLSFVYVYMWHTDTNVVTALFRRSFCSCVHPPNPNLAWSDSQPTYILTLFFRATTTTMTTTTVTHQIWVFFLCKIDTSPFVALHWPGHTHTHTQLTKVVFWLSGIDLSFLFLSRCLWTAIVYWQQTTKNAACADKGCVLKNWNHNTDRHRPFGLKMQKKNPIETCLFYIFIPNWKKKCRARE